MLHQYLVVCVVSQKKFELFLAVVGLLWVRPGAWAIQGALLPLTYLDLDGIADGR